MKILNFGSLNIDHVYAVDHFVRPGESLACLDYRQFAGGKGSNQSMALALAGARVFHAGKLGRDGAWLKDTLAARGVDTSFVDIIDRPSGHAVIQVDREGENAIVLHGGANRCITAADAERALPGFEPGDVLLLQNEISATAAIMRRAARQGLRIVFNPAPMHDEVRTYPLELVSVFIVNEIEAQGLTGEADAGAVLEAMRRCYPAAAVVLTLGSRGAAYADADQTLTVPAETVTAVDTTAAGDTFIGYFLAELMQGHGPQAALQCACKAAAICVTRPGAADSIPSREELNKG